MSYDGEGHADDCRYSTCCPSSAASRSASAFSARARNMLERFRMEALNGVVCTPRDTWKDPLFGGDGSGRFMDVEAMTCGPCRTAWRLLLAALDARKESE